MKRFSANDLLGYEHPYYQLEGVWNRQTKIVRFLFPVSRPFISESESNHFRSAIQLSDMEGWQQPEIGCVEYPDFNHPDYPEDMQDSCQSLVYVHDTMRVSLGSKEHRELAALYVSLGEGSLSYDQVYRRKVANEVGLRATRIVSCYEPAMIPIETDLAV